MNAEWLIEMGNEWWVIIVEWLMMWWVMSDELYMISAERFIVMGDGWWDSNG